MEVFLVDVIDILSSYFFNSSVELFQLEIDSSATENDETDVFLDELSLRHDIAHGKYLLKVLNLVANRSSTKTIFAKDLSTLPLRGRLDINKYLQVKNKTSSFTRIYPVKKISVIPITPENILIKSVLFSLKNRLTKYKLRETAEKIAAQELIIFLNATLHDWPWNSIPVSNNLQRVYLESKRRIQKRQTGNSLGYNSFLDWFEYWKLPYIKPSEYKSDLLKNILAFPSGNFFEEKVFEIWCIKLILKGLTRIGYIVINGPKALHKKDRKPIYLLRKDTSEIEIWFQKQEPFGKPQWNYTNTGKPLKGIPDIVLTSNKVSSPMIIDAKLRHLTTTKSEETYKMLGYLENFRSSLLDDTFFGLLIFISEKPLNLSLTGPNDSNLDIISVPVNDIFNLELMNNLENSLNRWISHHT